MHRRAWAGFVIFPILAFAALAGWTLASGGSGLSNPERMDARPQLQQALRRLPLRFEAGFESNDGQAGADVKFMARAGGTRLWLTASGAVLAGPQGREAVRMKLLGAEASPLVEGLEEQPGRSHYFVGNDPSRWRTDIPAYSRVRYRAVYPGIDLVFHGDRGELEYDFVVAPGADYKSIAMAFEGAQQVALDGDGNLTMQTAAGSFRQRAPRIYQEPDGQETNGQETDGAKREIEGGYVLLSGNRVGFQVGSHDPAATLVIDPVLEFSTYLGGDGEDEGISIALDDAGNVYITGGTSSSNFPTTSGALQNQSGGDTMVFVTKLSPDGSSLLYSTYLGGSKASVGHRIAVDSSGNAYVTGRTEAADFPTAKPLQAAFGGGSDDAFIAKLNPSGSALLYSTYLGGSEYDQGRSIAVDAAGNAYITGITESDNFPTANPLQAARGGEQDAILVKLNAAGSALEYSSYLGGSRNDVGHAIAVDAQGSAYITGLTRSANFPTANPLQPASAGGVDTILVKVNPSGTALVYSTYLGGSRGDESRAVDVDAQGNAYITGYTQSYDFPRADAWQAVFGGGSHDAFIAKVSASGASLLFSTFLGGSAGDYGRGLALDARGNVYLTGYTASGNFPLQPPFQHSYGGGSADAFVAKLDGAGRRLLYSTFLGGSRYERGRGIAAGAAGTVFVSGRTESRNFPAVKALFPNFSGGPNEGFLAKISDGE